MSKSLAWLTILSLLLASSVRGQQDYRDLLPGNWRGVGVLRGVPYHFRITIRGEDSKFKCSTLIYSGLTEDQARKAAKGIRFRRDPFPFSVAAVKSYAVSTDGDLITFNNLKTRSIHDPPRGRAVWPKDKLSGTLKAPGLIVGKWDEQGSFWLAKDEILSKPPPLNLATKRRHELACISGQPYKYTC
jgi:hypothetical protein